MDKLTDLIECPVCFYRLSPPVETCDNGHAICLDCRAPLENCPTCRGRFIESHNTLLNQIIESIPLNCENMINGCGKIMLQDEKLQHETLCDYRSIKCFDRFCSNRYFIYCNIGIHFKSIHNTKSFDFNEKCFFKVKLNVNDDDSSLGILYERTFRKCFLWRYFIDNEEGVLTVGFQYVGKRDKSMKYLYEISFSQGHGIKFKSGGFCLPYMEDNDEMKLHPRSLKLDINEIFFHNVPGHVNIFFKIKPLE